MPWRKVPKADLYQTRLIFPSAMRGGYPGYPQQMMPGMTPMAPGMQPMAQGMQQGYAMPPMMPGMAPSFPMPGGHMPAMSAVAQASGDHEFASPKRRRRQIPEEDLDGECPNTKNGPALGLPPPPPFTTTSRS